MIRDLKENRLVIRDPILVLHPLVPIVLGCCSRQCRSKDNISGGGGGGTRAPEAQGTRGVWGHAPPENFEI